MDGKDRYLLLLFRMGLYQKSLSLQEKLGLSELLCVF